MSSVPTPWPEQHDFVSVVISGIEWFGYIDGIDFDMRNPMIEIEFFPGVRSWFSMGDVKKCNFPQEKK